MAKGYWRKRQGMIYYRYLDVIVRGVATDCKSMIDVGARNTPLIENFEWVDERVTLDVRAPYNSARVRGIEMDFLQFKPEKQFDIALCCQVLEHIPDAGAFARHLFEVGKRVLISVPYLWPEGGTKNHIHDPVDMEKLARWTGREPAYHIIVQEPLSLSAKSRRLIAYYPAPGEQFTVRAARDAATERKPKKLKKRHKAARKHRDSVL
jgi:hypothetical protein